ncbi:MAG: hypothetical protein FJ038_03900 [Chloroflexi bacterium]|nr:hypothetical protein [Chloroflexota bacterium]
MPEPVEKFAHVTTNGWSTEEWEEIEWRAKKNNVTCEAIVRALVQYAIRATAVVARPPAPAPATAKRTKGGTHLALVITDAEGHRLCVECRTNRVYKKNPNGPGRYPRTCEECR